MPDRTDYNNGQRRHSTVAEYSPYHPKVAGLIPVPAAVAGRDKIAAKLTTKSRNCVKIFEKKEDTLFCYFLQIVREA